MVRHRSSSVAANNAAHQTGPSRSTIAVDRAWTIGEPVITYLTGLRSDLAADLLRSSDCTPASVARQVGYGSPYALSSAFTRIRGGRPAGPAPGGAAHDRGADRSVGATREPRSRHKRPPDDVAGA